MSTLLKQIRTRTKQTTYQVAKALEVAQSQYFRVENGDASASPEMVDAIANHFEVPANMIFTPSRFVVAPAEGARKPVGAVRLQEAS